jgi:hypothetical protein
LPESLGQPVRRTKPAHRGSIPLPVVEPVEKPGTQSTPMEW